MDDHCYLDYLSKQARQVGEQLVWIIPRVFGPYRYVRRWKGRKFVVRSDVPLAHMRR